jgi:thioesterase domain-containing protein
VIGYADLARHLGEDRPFYGLQARGLNGDIAEDSHLEDMAAHYIEEIRTVQRHGPYLLGGWCMGGIVAYEMARQLQDQGEQVDMLAMIQSAHPDYPRFRPGTTIVHKLFSRLIARIDREITLLAERGERSTPSHFGQRIGRVALIVSGIGQKWLGTLLSKLGIPFAYSETYKLYALEEVHEAALAAYKPGPYDGRVAIFRAGSQPLGIYPDATLGWGGLLNKDNVTLYEIPGNQVGIISEPRVELLAQQLAGCLTESGTELDPSDRSPNLLKGHFSLTGAGTDALPGR